jgi:3-phenylpropionate/trans-cinnamate dioxygenase ferredoxin reductase subunit
VYVHTADFYNEHGIELWTSTPVQAIDTAARELALQSGERIHFDRLLLTTGAEPRRLRVPGSHLDEVLYLVTFRTPIRSPRGSRAAESSS